jgi:hypothetical protein
MWNALGTPRRREILRQVWEREYCVGEICRANPDITMGAVSRTFAFLKMQDWCVNVRMGRRFTSLVKTNWVPCVIGLKNMWASRSIVEVRAEISKLAGVLRARKKIKETSP